MHGNVWEWCLDEITGAAGASHRMYRGGGWRDNPVAYCRAGIRYGNTPATQDNDLGLRLARVPSAK